MSRRRLLVAGLAAAGAVAVVASWAAAAGDGAWARVERGDLVETVAATGALEAVEAADFGPPQVSDLWDLKVAFLVAEGKEVAAGEPLVGFDASELERRLGEAQAAAAEAAERLRKVEADLDLEREDGELRTHEAEAAVRRDRLKVDVPAEIAQAVELAKARADLRSAEEQLAFERQRLAALVERRRAELGQLRSRRDRAQQKVQELERAIAQMTVRAPRSGTAVYVADWRGEKVKVGDSVWRGQKVVSLPDLGRLKATLDIAEPDAGRLAAGQAVRLRLDAHPDREYLGTLVAFRRAVGRQSPTSRVKVVKGEVELRSVDVERMRPGMRLAAELEVGRHAGVVLLPVGALRYRDGLAEVALRRWGRRVAVRPSLGARNTSFFEVRAGVEAGDRVWTGAAAVEP